MLVNTGRGHGMLEALFSSRVRVQILTLFLMNPGVQFHARGLVPRVGAHYNAIWEELKHLEGAGFILSETSARTRMYRINPQYPLLPELRAMILKTTGIGEVIREAVSPLSETRAAFIYGSFADGQMDQQSDIDLILIGTIHLPRLAPVIARLEKTIGRSINYIAYSLEEWLEKQRSREPFILNVLASPKIMLIGDEDALRATGATRAHQTVQSTTRRNAAIAPSRHARPRHRGAEFDRRS